MPKEKKLKAFLVSYTYEEAHSENNEEVVRSVVVVAYDKKEAGDLFIAWLNLKNMYYRVHGVVVQGLRRNKKNARFFTEDFYEKQKLYIYNNDAYVKQYH